ncbi:MAG: TRAP transporter substrate-binding protein DctP [Gammaproteobacteria bacterium]|nr:TRAP transporter substrate-binding protein DctP [Gammaproteobacteria bacterium]NNL99870.1 TRAP transporter substrate-binding protein DctP [Gammaproteobacteria bacterium]
MAAVFRVLVAAALMVLLAGCGGDVSTGAVDQRTFRWKMVTTWPPNFPVLQEGAEKLAADIEAMSGGRLTISVFAGGELVPALQAFDAVQLGSVEMGHGAAYYWAGKVPAAQFFSTVPFGMTAAGMYQWLYAGGGLELWQELYQPFGVRPFPAGNTGIQMGGWFNKRIDSVDDLKGLKMRIPGLGGKVLAAAGGNPVLMSGGELYTALERGTIDATEWVGPLHDQRLGLDRAAQYYYYPGWHEPGTVLELVVNENAWQELPEDLQRIVATATAAANLWMMTQSEVRNALSYDELIAAGKTEVLSFPSDVLGKLHDVTRATLAAEAEKDADFARVYAAYQEFRARHARWNAVTGDAYDDALRAPPP